MTGRCLRALVATMAIGFTGCLTGVSETNTPDAGDGPTDSALVDEGPTDGAASSDLETDDGGPTDVEPDLSDMSVDTNVDMGVDMGEPDLFVPMGVCGNDVLEAGETCDPCALDCDDQNSCTTDAVVGSSNDCVAYCRNESYVGCTNGDGCCPAGCDSSTDDDCSSTCGDGTVDANETCDGDCPTSCDDGDPATRDLMTGSAATCSVQCSNVEILRCVSGDGYCPGGCTWATDRDCGSSCGNGFVEDQETCDPPGACPACDDGNPCTTDEMSGNAATCDVVCTHEPIETCIDGDGCCAARCDVDEDNDCSATCGDGQVQAGETCDGPPDCNNIVCDQGGACSTSIRTGHPQNCNTWCGYPEIVGCTDADGCCPFGCTADTDTDCDAECGNGVIEPGEFCDPPGQCETECFDDGDVCTATVYDGDPATCDAHCSHPAITACGAAEGCCPPGCNANNDPDCDPVCGNDVVEDGEVCDGNCPSCDDSDPCTFDSNVGSASTCDLICQHTDITTCGPTEGCCPSSPDQCNATNDTDCPSICGNGVEEPGELCDGDCPTDCDDGDACTTDTLSGDATTCDAVCQYQTVTACVGGDGCCPPGCDATTDSDC